MYKNHKAPQPQNEKTESRIQREIVDALKASGCLVVRINSGRKGSVQLAPAGTPDLLAITPNDGCRWIEVKRPGQQPTDVQREFHEFLRGSGEKVVVATSAEEAVACLTS